MMIIGIVLICLVVTAIIITEVVKNNDSDSIAVGLFYGLLLCVGIVLTIGGATQNDPVEKSTTKNTLKVEIRQTTIDGVIMKSDTVYIFTPKK